MATIVTAVFRDGIFKPTRKLKLRPNEKVKLHIVRQAERGPTLDIGPLAGSFPALASVRHGHFVEAKRSCSVWNGEGFAPTCKPSCASFVRFRRFPSFRSDGRPFDASQPSAPVPRCTIGASWRMHWRTAPAASRATAPSPRPESFPPFGEGSPTR